MSEHTEALIASAIWGDLDGLTVAVIGLGASGLAAANALARRGADVVTYDDRGEQALAPTLKRLDPRVKARCGGGFVARPGEVCVLSPGVPPHSETFRRARASSSALIGEVELFYRLDRAANEGLGHPIIAVSGTDGKTTTASLIAHLLRTAGHDILLAGNIGDPLCGFAGKLGDGAVVVAEVSAFQLHTCDLFRPRIAVLTNIAEDHVDWFAGDREAYADAKLKVADRCGPGDTIVAHAADPAFAPLLAPGRGPHVMGFAASDSPDLALGCDGTWLWAGTTPGTKVRLIEIDALGTDATRPMRGAHNVANALAAAGAALALGADLGSIQAGLRSFDVPPHRLQPAGDVAAVRFVNDSKATNPHAALAGLAATEVHPGERLVWIGGGSEKDADFGPLCAELERRDAIVILLGDAAPRIAAALPSHIQRMLCDDMHAAVARAFEQARPGGVVLLSPACASFGLFRSYVHRGDVFMDAVARLSAAAG